MYWTYSDYPLEFPKSKYYNKLNLIGTSSFNGKIMMCNNECSYSGLTYECTMHCNSIQSEHNDWCKISTYLKEICPGCSEIKQVQSLCTLFADLSTFSDYFVSFSFVFIIHQILYIIYTCFSCQIDLLPIILSHAKNHPGLYCFAIWMIYSIYVAIFIAFIANVLCWAIFINLVRTSPYLVFGDNCNDFLSDGSAPKLCASFGVYFAFVCMIFNIIIYIWGFSIYFRKYLPRLTRPPRLNLNIDFRKCLPRFTQRPALNTEPPITVTEIEFMDEDNNKESFRIE